jgi:hypothetical protein
MLDRVYHIQWLEDITDEEKAYAERIMKQIPHDMKYLSQQELPFSHDAVMNNIINFKRIHESLENNKG